MRPRESTIGRHERVMTCKQKLDSDDEEPASVRREAVEQAGPADPLQVRRCAARGFM